MPEAGRIQPVKKAACPFCGQVLPGDPGDWFGGVRTTCPRCGKKNSGRSAPDTAPSLPIPPLSISAQTLKWQVQAPSAPDEPAGDE